MECVFQVCSWWGFPACYTGLMKNGLSTLVSRIFDPLLVIPLLLFLAVTEAWLNGETVHYLLVLFLIDVGLPGFVLVYFVQKGKIKSGWDVRKRKERVPLFMFVVFAHFAGLLLAHFSNKHPLTEYLASFWVMTVVYALITNHWKISVHSGVLSSFVTFLVLVNDVRYAVLYVLVLLVIWARVEGRYHRLSQALAGGAIPLVLMPLSFWWFGLL